MTLRVTTAVLVRQAAYCGLIETVLLCTMVPLHRLLGDLVLALLF